MTFKRGVTNHLLTGMNLQVVYRVVFFSNRRFDHRFNLLADFFFKASPKKRFSNIFQYKGCITKAQDVVKKRPGTKFDELSFTSHEKNTSYG